MSYVSVGSCPTCGAPIYAESPYWSILPPPTYYSCSCVKTKTITLTSGVTTTQLTTTPQTWSTTSNSTVIYPGRIHEEDIPGEISSQSTYDHLHLPPEEQP